MIINRHSRTLQVPAGSMVVLAKFAEEKNGMKADVVQQFDRIWCHAAKFDKLFLRFEMSHHVT